MTDKSNCINKHSIEDPIVQNIRDGFDELFLGGQNEITERSKQLFTTLGIEGFAEIVMRTKKYGSNASQKILRDLIKVSHLVYTNLDKLPIKKKVVLPETNGSYKFIVTSLPHTFFRGESTHDITKEDTNVLFLISTGDTMHADITERIGIKGQLGETNVLGGAWIDIDHNQKILSVFSDSGHYGSCSNQIVQWMLKEYEDKGYTITVNIDSQGDFFTGI